MALSSFVVDGVCFKTLTLYPTAFLPSGFVTKALRNPATPSPPFHAIEQIARELCCIKDLN